MSSRPDEWLLSKPNGSFQCVRTRDDIIIDAMHVMYVGRHIAELMAICLAHDWTIVRIRR